MLAELEKICKERRSIRAWADKPVPEELLLQALEIAGWAPNSGGRQPYQFYLILNQAKIREIAQAVQDKADLMASWPEAEYDQDTVQKWRKNCSFFASAPAAVAVCTSSYQSVADKLLNLRQNDPVAVEMKQAREYANSKLQSAAAAITQMLLAFHARGLGAVWMSGPVQAKKEIEAILGIPGNLDFVAIIPVGYPAQNPPAPSHRPLSDLVTIVR